MRTGDPSRLGDYDLLGRLGEGGQGVVYLATDESGRQVALKWLRPQYAEDAVMVERFVREAAVAKRVAPFCTAQVLGSGVEDDRPYIVSEFIEGASLQSVVAQSGPRTGAGLHRLAIGMATALAAIHQAGIAHRDFKPANVIIAPDGPRVIDFGISRALDATSTLSSSPIGTPAYMAPEQLLGQMVGSAADMFSWGATTLFAATGQAPFGSDTLPAVIHRVLSKEPDLSSLDGPLRDLVVACLNKDPEQRPSAEQVILRLIQSPVTASDPVLLREAAAVAAPGQPSSPPPPAGAKPAETIAGPPASGETIADRPSFLETIADPPASGETIADRPSFLETIADPSTLPQSAERSTAFGVAGPPTASAPPAPAPPDQHAAPPPLHYPHPNIQPTQPTHQVRFSQAAQLPSPGPGHPHPAPPSSPPPPGEGGSGPRGRTLAFALGGVLAVVLVGVLAVVALRGQDANGEQNSPVAVRTADASSAPVPTEGLTAIPLPGGGETKLYEDPADRLTLTSYEVQDAGTQGQVDYARDSLTGDFTKYLDQSETVVSPNGRYLAVHGNSAAEDGYDTVTIVDREAGKQSTVKTVQQPRTTAIGRWSKDSARLLLVIQRGAGASRTTEGFVILTAKDLAADVVGNDDSAVDQSPYGWAGNTGGTVAVADDGYQRSLRFYDTSGKQVRSIDGVGKVPDTMDFFSPSGAFFVTDCPGDTPNMQCIWNTESGQQADTITSACDKVLGWYDESHLYCWESAGTGRRVSVIDLQGHPVRTLLETPPGVTIEVTFTRRPSTTS
ncbi:serine/threonine protein kinase [Streptosporangium sp. NBC_01810]|uniref:serine/threonine protein kinase n=1 Tax=Streptosporangium sp. NBC_01810 TaxID=2975951 RepID=UPI002DD934BD|nr:serine/threonine-protein kinase [Streptosporangium sp. NBC_01810]WSA27764.1 serine/threonine protein kinase [Streptosporangium sp. NBC_01810]